MTLDREHGQLCTLASASRTFYRSLYDPDSGRLRIDRQGDLWDAVQIARAAGATGQGHTVAVIDCGFDTTVDRLRVAAGVDVAAEGDAARYGWHGTVVALLVNEIAPDARLVLVDAAGPDGGLSRSVVGEILRSPAVRRADVVNLSMEFISESRPDPVDVDFAVLLGTDPPREPFLRELASWRDHSGMYGDGCAFPCAICAALDALEPRTVVVTAAGNLPDRTAVCPSAHPRAIGLGFENRPTAFVDEMTTVGAATPDDFTQNLRVELSVPQPRGFLGTSFAAPLVSGFAALLADPAEVAVLTRLRAGLAPLMNLSSSLRGRPSIGAELAGTVLAGFAAYGNGFPEAHQHWRVPRPDPCASCALFLHDWYRNYTAVLAVLAEPAAAVVRCGNAALVLPTSADVACNHALALRAFAATLPDGSADRRRCLELAAGEYRRALARQPENGTAAAGLAATAAGLG